MNTNEVSERPSERRCQQHEHRPAAPAGIPVLTHDPAAATLGAQQTITDHHGALALAEAGDPKRQAA
jgi:hypothetical protein